MLYELHLTVDHDSCYLADWVGFCNRQGIKPLDIRLAGHNPNNPRQLMFAAVTEGNTTHAEAWRGNLQEAARREGFDVVRSKLEVPLDKAGDYKYPVYHECHVKSLIPQAHVGDVVKNMASLGWVASTNALFTHIDELEKWYFTLRAYDCDYLTASRHFKTSFATIPDTSAFHTLRMESETVINDSNEALDAGWALDLGDV